MKTLREQLKKLEDELGMFRDYPNIANIHAVIACAVYMLGTAKDMDALLKECAKYIGDIEEDMGWCKGLHEKLQKAGYGV